MQNLENLHKFSYNNKQEIEISKDAACFHCLSKFDAKKVVAYKGGKHAECPFCHHDTVIGDRIITGKFAIEIPLAKNVFIQLNREYDTEVRLDV